MNSTEIAIYMSQIKDEIKDISESLTLLVKHVSAPFQEMSINKEDEVVHKKKQLSNLLFLFVGLALGLLVGLGATVLLVSRQIQLGGVP